MTRAPSSVGFAMDLYSPSPVFTEGGTGMNPFGSSLPNRSHSPEPRPMRRGLSYQNLSSSSGNINILDHSPLVLTRQLTRQHSAANLNASGGVNTNYMDHALLVAPSLPANVYVEKREGNILSRGMILKSDHFPHKSVNLDINIVGSPNYRQIKPSPICGVGQPTVSGIHTMLNMVRAQKRNGIHVGWINLREEPVVYISSRPFVLREFESPMQNMSDFMGISASRLMEIEAELKSDILREVRGVGGR